MKNQLKKKRQHRAFCLLKSTVPLWNHVRRTHARVFSRLDDLLSCAIGRIVTSQWPVPALTHQEPLLDVANGSSQLI